jgi:hypothetical protein
LGAQVRTKLVSSKNESNRAGICPVAKDLFTHSRECMAQCLQITSTCSLKEENALHNPQVQNDEETISLWIHPLHLLSVIEM